MFSSPTQNKVYIVHTMARLLSFTFTYLAEYNIILFDLLFQNNLKRKWRDPDAGSVGSGHTTSGDSGHGCSDVEVHRSSFTHPGWSNFQRRSILSTQNKCQIGRAILDTITGNI